MREKSPFLSQGKRGILRFFCPFSIRPRINHAFDRFAPPLFAPFFDALYSCLLIHSGKG